MTDAPSTDAQATPADGPPGDRSGMARRFLVFGGAAAAGSAVAAVASSSPASAGHNGSTAYDSEGVVHMDVTNTGSGSTRVSSNQSGTAAFVAMNNYTVGISRPDGILGRTNYTTSNCAGVAGSCEANSGGIGVLGTSDAADGTGVYGFSGSNVPGTKPQAGAGVCGTGPAFGVVALATGAAGVALTANAPGANAKAAVLNGRTEVVGPLDAQSVSAGTLKATTTVTGATVTASEGLRLTRTAGKVTTTGKSRSVTVSNLPLTANSVVVATLQKAKKGLYVAAAVPLGGNQVKISFNKKAKPGTVVGWVVVN